MLMERKKRENNLRKNCLSRNRSNCEAFLADGGRMSDNTTVLPTPCNIYATIFRFLSLGFC